MYNPSLREEPIDRPAAVIPVKQETSILDWLESTGRLLAREDYEASRYLDEDDPEISDLMGGDEGYEELEIDDDDDEAIDLE